MNNANIIDNVANEIEEFLTSIEKTQIDKIPLLDMKSIEPWFLAAREKYPQAESGILMKYSAIQEQKKHGWLNTLVSDIEKAVFSGMKNGYIQLLLDDEFRVIKNSSKKIVMRYFEADKEDEQIKNHFGKNNIIHFE